MDDIFYRFRIIVYKCIIGKKKGEEKKLLKGGEKGK